MAYRISDTFDLDHNTLVSEGVLDTFTDLDSHFYIDPYLLSSTTIPEMSSCYENMQNHFKKIIKILDSANKDDRLWREAVKLLTFPEVPNFGLGYSKNGKRGSAIGKRLANKLVEVAKEIIDSGIKDPVIFELIGLFEEGIGADRISDMTAYIILPELLNFTQRVTKQFSISSIPFNFKKISYSVPKDPRTNKPILLIPHEIISPLPVAYSWDDIDLVCVHNKDLRNKVNIIIGETWKEAHQKVHKKDLKYIILEQPKLLQDLIDSYKRKIPQKYNFEKDPIGEFIWYSLSREYTQQFPIDFSEFKIINAENILIIVKKICQKYSELIENNGLFQIFYNDEKKLRNERFAQLLFYGIADSYCEANNLDLSRECNGGRGSVDFKISSGYLSKISVEVKYSNNKRLVHGFTNQLPIYDKAEKSKHSIYLIIQTSSSTTSIKKVLQLHSDAQNKGQRVPDVIIINGNFQQSASKL